MIQGIESWKTTITMFVAMERCKTGSEGTGGLYITGNNGVHIDSFEEGT